MADQPRSTQYAIRNTQYETIRRPYSIIREFGTRKSVGNKYGVRGIHNKANSELGGECAEVKEGLPLS